MIRDSTQFEGYLRQNRLMQRGIEYHTVAVIGAQSSGKSKHSFPALMRLLGTLLNLLFDTKFEILDAQKLGRGQITKGVWMSASRDGGILIFDLEGTDSKERGEQRLVRAIHF